MLYAYTQAGSDSDSQQKDLNQRERFTSLRDRQQWVQKRLSSQYRAKLWTRTWEFPSLLHAQWKHRDVFTRRHATNVHSSPFHNLSSGEEEGKKCSVKKEGDVEWQPCWGHHSEHWGGETRSRGAFFLVGVPVRCCLATQVLVLGHVCLGKTKASLVNHFIQNVKRASLVTVTT